MKKFLIALLIVLLNSSIAGAWFSTPPSSSNASTLEGHAASYFQVSHAYLTDIAGISAAAGDILYFNGTNWVRLAKDVGKYLKSGASAVSWDTPSGSLPDYESAGAVLYSNGSAWIRSTAPSLLALTLYGQSAGGGAQLSLGSSSGSSDPNNGKMNFRNSTNGYLFSITSGVSGADIGWTLPTAVSGGDNYLLNVDADGTMGYTAPSTFLAATALDDTKGNGDTAYFWSADKSYDELALKLGTTDKAADADKLDNHDSTYFQVDLGFVKGTMTDGKYCTYTASGTVLNCDSDAGSLAPGTAYQVYHTNSGATAGEWTSTLGATGTRLTKGWFTNLEVTNDITIGGNALATIYQPLDSTLTGLAGIAITVDGNNVTFPGTVTTTSADGARKVAVQENTVGVDPTSGAFEIYPDSDDLWKLNQHGVEYTFVLNGLASGGLIFGDSSPDAAGEIGYDGELKYYDAVGSKTVATVSGALGTPSFTALNMPSSNSDPSTTAGQIKHDSTDSNAASDGSIKVFTGNHVNTLVSATAVADDSYTIITKTEYIPIAYAENGAAAPADATVWADTRKARVRVFASDADDDVEIHWMVPDDYVGGIKFRVIGFVNSSTAPADTETVIMNLAGCSVGNSDDGGCTLGTGVNSTFTADATYAQHDRWSSAWSNEITVTNIVAGESAMLKLLRDVDDTYGQGVGVAGIEIKYKARVLMADRY